MDLANFSESRFAEIQSEFGRWLKNVGLDCVAFISDLCKAWR